MKWILGKNNINEAMFEEVENELLVKFPNEYKKIVLENNGGSPEFNIFNTKQTDGRVAEYLLSFDLKEKMNILETYKGLKDRLPLKIIPIISDPFGNYVCIDFSQASLGIVFWEHESNKIEKVTDSFIDFINSLY